VEAPCAYTPRHARRQHLLEMGGGVIRNRMPFETPVIPAEAAIQSVSGAFPMACEGDSRRSLPCRFPLSRERQRGGNHCAGKSPCFRNDTTVWKWGSARKDASAFSLTVGP
jgi:hypothetical protein